MHWPDVVILMETAIILLGGATVADKIRQKVENVFPAGESRTVEANRIMGRAFPD